MDAEQFMKAIEDGKRMVDPDNGMRIHPNKNGNSTWYINTPDCHVFMILEEFSIHDKHTIEGKIGGFSPVFIEPSHFIIDERWKE